MLPNTKSLKPFINKIICGDATEILKKIPSESIDCVVTSPPYWALRDYGVKGQIGLEASIEEYLEKLMEVFREVHRVLKKEGTCWVNFGDTYSGKTKGGGSNKPQNNIYDSLTKRATIPKIKVTSKIPKKSLCLIPSRFAIGMLELGFRLRNEIIWHKPNAMPSSVKDRFTNDFEKIFFFSKSERYYFKQQFEPVKNPKELKRKFSNPFDTHKYWNKTQKKDKKSLDAIKKSQERLLKRGRNKRCVWTIATGTSKGSHFATFPEKLIETPIKAGCPKGGIVLDPFMGSGTTAVVSKEYERKFVGVELSSEYLELAYIRLNL